MIMAIIFAALGAFCIFNGVKTILTGSLSAVEESRLKDYSKKGAKTYPGGSLASFVYNIVYDVIQVGGKGLPDDRIVIGQGKAVTAAVKAADLYKA
jgi:hypothetical protein